MNATIRTKRWRQSGKDLLEFIQPVQRHASKSKQATSRKSPWRNWSSKRSSPATVNTRYHLQAGTEVGNEILKVDNLFQSIEGRPCSANSNSMYRKETKSPPEPRPSWLTSFFEVINGKNKAMLVPEWGTTVTTAYLPNDNSEYLPAAT